MHNLTHAEKNRLSHQQRYTTDVGTPLTFISGLYIRSQFSELAKTLIIEARSFRSKLKVFYQKIRGQDQIEADYEHLSRPNAEMLLLKVNGKMFLCFIFQGSCA